ncbi:GNAT family N-acetyltransferase [Promicromonospora sp. CA-289599]|uniref:GNAT family N-acetyltransferase n=1 Tax=Promicromonospora sp. CA-289599 TaxID=3240014 RepID=UPI003D8BCF3D
MGVVEVNNTLAGTVGLKKTHWRAATTEIGYWAAPWARGRGLITEATRLLTDWSLTTGGMRRVELRAATENIASQIVAQRAGFTHEGVLRDAGFIHDGRVDLAVFSRVVADI